MDTIEKTGKYILNTYNRYPVVFEKGEGCFLYTKDGEKFLDMGSGIAVTLLGHCHPELVKAVKEQAETLWHTSNLYYSTPVADLAEKLINATGAKRVFFCNSGAEANEGALKLARKYGKQNGKTNKTKIISMYHSFHGRTMATVTVTAQEKYQKPFYPLLPDVYYAEYNDLDSVKNLMDDDVCAVILEPIQGEGGVHPASHDFLKGVRDLCDKHDALLIYDEVQCGMGRTGSLFCHMQYKDCTPDVFTTAKGLAGGLPLGVFFVNEKTENILQPGDHASTFGGNPIVAAAANAVLDVFNKENILNAVKENSSYFVESLKKLQQKYNVIKDIRGVGFLLGIEIDYSAAELVKELLEHHIVTVPAGTSVVRFLPPLIIKKEEIDLVLNALEQIFKKRT